jgi:hypothetical protein
MRLLLGIPDDWVPDGDAAWLDCRAVDPKAGLALVRDDAQDRWISPRSGRINVDDETSLVARVHTYPRAADAQRVADPRVFGEGILARRVDQ